MTASNILKNKTIAIWGLGLMGGSFALALAGQCRKLIGIDPDPAVVQFANEHNITDIASISPNDLIAEADVVILSAPVKVIMEQIAQLTDLTQKSTMVMDFGSTKSEIVTYLNNLPPRFDPIGGHPMCGTEKASVWNASKDLFQNTNFALTPLERTTEDTCRLAETLVCIVGANPIYLDAAVHDQWVASTSHLAYLVSSAYTSAVPVDASPLASSGFISTSRLAASSPEMMLDVITSNREAILNNLNHFQEIIKNISALLNANDEQALSQFLEKAAESRKAILQHREVRI